MITTARSLYSLIAFVPLTLLLGTVGCQTTSDPASESSKTETAAVKAEPASADPAQVTPALPIEDVTEDETDETFAAPALSAADEPELRPEDFSEETQPGFCIDDIYVKYLVSQYKSTNAVTTSTPAPAPKTSKRSARRRSHSEDRRESNVEALFHAKNRMLGGTSPYFGALPVVANERVELWIQYYKTTGRREFMRWLVRGESVKRVVQPLLQESGIPIEFFYLAMIESGFNNGAYSRARATGTWQFMSGTAKNYGLKINHWVDERRDPIKSSIAAASYLKDLYDQLGDWHLAMAAYNSGPGKVRKAIRLGGTRNFWELVKTPHLPKETKNYVPKVLAAILLATDSRGHGFDFHANPSDGIPDTEVIVKRPVKLDELATSLGVTTKMLRHWNPELIRDITPPASNGYALRLSSPYANIFPSVEDKLSQLDVTDVQMHVVRKGDTLSRIAKQYKVQIKQILSLNPELDSRRLRPGKQVAVPIPGVVQAKPPKPA